MHLVQLAAYLSEVLPWKMNQHENGVGVYVIYAFMVTHSTMLFNCSCVPDQIIALLHN